MGIRPQFPIRIDWNITQLGWAWAPESESACTQVKEMKWHEVESLQKYVQLIILTNSLFMLQSVMHSPGLCDKTNYNNPLPCFHLHGHSQIPFKAFDNPRFPHRSTAVLRAQLFGILNWDRGKVFLQDQPLCFQLDLLGHHSQMWRCGRRSDYPRWRCRWGFSIWIWLVDHGSCRRGQGTSPIELWIRIQSSRWCGWHGHQRGRYSSILLLGWCARLDGWPLDHRQHSLELHVAGRFSKVFKDVQW